MKKINVSKAWQTPSLEARTQTSPSQAFRQVAWGQAVPGGGPAYSERGRRGGRHWSPCQFPSRSLSSLPLIVTASPEPLGASEISQRHHSVLWESVNVPPQLCTASGLGCFGTLPLTTTHLVPAHVHSGLLRGLVVLQHRQGLFDLWDTRGRGWCSCSSRVLGEPCLPALAHRTREGPCPAPPPPLTVLTGFHGRDPRPPSTLPDGWGNPNPWAGSEHSALSHSLAWGAAGRPQGLK